ncbi:hypothetical protein BG015_002888 [Linnemannia schmuckeri]|uniref:F-box domain-containing protein n=1 Tax=Linnemannia schmuckeri TaxID=64567 RepID=A0A9P5VFM7_9FUNG|nr:hypothetical protein BG015_002888 [Linnemannia schmuckeri]
MPYSSPYFRLRGRSNNNQLNILNSQPLQSDYNRIYSRDSKIYANCDYDSDNQDHCESEEDLDGYERMIVQPLFDSPALPELPVEILELVCTHLSQTTLRHSVNQVCKKWHEVSNRFLRRAGIWKPVKGAQELLLKKWPRINTLELWFNGDHDFGRNPFYVTTKTAFWDAFVTAITESSIADKQGEAQRNDNSHISNDGDSHPMAPSCLLHTIRHLEVRGLYMNYSEVAPDLRGHLQFIKSLTITTLWDSDSTPLFTILADFPTLKSFNFNVQYRKEARLTHGDDEDDIDEAVVAVDDLSNMFLERYQLQQFFIHGMRTHLRVLQRLLITCPDLRVFHVKNLNVDTTSGQEGSDDDEEEEEEHRVLCQRLIDLAAKYCPKLERYIFRQFNRNTDEDDLRGISRNIPDQRMYSMGLYSISSHGQDILAVRDLFAKITILEIESSTGVWDTDRSDRLNMILCLTPNLLHLLGSDADLHTSSLWKLPPPVVLTKKLVFATVGDRKRYERKERRWARQQTLTGPRSSDPTAVDTPTFDSSIPVTWQLYNLKTLELHLTIYSRVVDFTDYISRYRLFRNLVIFNLGIPALKVGQRMTFANTRAGAAAAAAAAAAASSDDEPQPGQPLRYPNELLALRPLRCLEECILHANDVPGMIVATNFNFLKRRKDFQTISFLPAGKNRKRRETRKNKKSVLKMTATYDDEVDKDDESEEEEKEEGKKNETFWPKLTTFCVFSLGISPSTETSKFKERLERIRPGVIFRFQSRSSLF